MIYHLPNLLDKNDINFLFEIYRSLNNVFVHPDGAVTERHVTGVIGYFILSRFKKSEVGDRIWDKIISKVSETANSGTFEILSFRILRYQKNGFIPQHLDKPSDDYSLVVQLNDPHEYTGGHLIIGGSLVELECGDSVFYTGEVKHSVSHIKSGVRYVLNIRLEKVK